MVSDRQPAHSGASSLLPWLEALAALRTLHQKRVDPAQIAWWNRVPTLRADCVERCHDHGAIDLLLRRHPVCLESDLRKMDIQLVASIENQDRAQRGKNQASRMVPFVRRARKHVANAATDD